ncbi:UNVERIFIED_CONTAM: hypothetical protein Scaly_0568000 [Sesamum calycinum]|uniref:Reverse transcriptase Ty1/copia-type domain-containing protein n=1 Tax=Sesamum calycinum TaxID=2727403 RepID=A0AAW2RSA2_9LAMI
MLPLWSLLLITQRTVLSTFLDGSAHPLDLPIAPALSLPSNSDSDLHIALRRGPTQTYDVGYFETFSHVARLNIHLHLFCFVIHQDLFMSQMDVKDVFRYSDLSETIFMEQPPRSVAQE